MMTGMPDMRRRTPEPPAAAPEIQFKPGMANELLHELAPLPAEEGIDVNNIDGADLDTLQQALGRAIERRNCSWLTCACAVCGVEMTIASSTASANRGSAARAALPCPG